MIFLTLRLIFDVSWLSWQRRHDHVKITLRSRQDVIMRVYEDLSADAAGGAFGGAWEASATRNLRPPGRLREILRGSERDDLLWLGKDRALPTR
jgi:hypothetical protein